MPVVFVHGVNVRRDNGGKFNKAVKQRDSLFRRFALNQLPPNLKTTQIVNPYWGGDAATFAWNQASLPTGKHEQFGGADELVQTLLLELDIPLPEDPEMVALAIARVSFRDAVDILLALAGETADSDEARDELAALAVKAIDYAENNPKPAWLASVDDDQAFFAHLRDKVSDWEPQGTPQLAEDLQLEAFGLSEAWDKLSEALSRLTGAAGSLGSGLVLSATRRPLHNAISHFLGDIFVYLDERGDKTQPGPIVQTILDDIDAATGANEPLILVGHSMGGNVLYDILTHFRPGLNCDLFLTVGSQVALFEELKLFKESQTNIPVNPSQDRVARPANIKKWLNVYDTNDILSFAVEKVFDGTQDFEYNTGKGLLSAHSTYFIRPSFHERLGVRLKAFFA